jgi:outer membrane protein W
MASAQFEKKVNTHFFLGVPFIPAGEGTPSQNVLNGYGMAPYFGIGLNYALDAKLSVQGDFRFMYNSKLNGVYALYHGTVDLQLKYNFIQKDKPLSPYVIFGVSVGSVHITQKENSEDQTEFNDLGPEELDLYNISKRNPEIKFTMFPSIGIVGGLGIDYTYKQTVGFNVALMYSTSNIDSNGFMKEYFPDNQSQLNFAYLQVGVKLAFLRSKSI